MVDNKQIGIGTAVTGGFLLIGLFAFMFTSGESYYLCEEKPELGIGTCDGFSKYVSEVGKCINYTMYEINSTGNITKTNLGNKICKAGWVEINMSDFDPYSDLQELLDDLELINKTVNITDGKDDTTEINTSIANNTQITKIVPKKFVTKYTNGDKKTVEINETTNQSFNMVEAYYIYEEVQEIINNSN